MSKTIGLLILLALMSIFTLLSYEKYEADLRAELSYAERGEERCQILGKSADKCFPYTEEAYKKIQPERFGLFFLPLGLTILVFFVMVRVAAVEAAKGPEPKTPAAK